MSILSTMAVAGSGARAASVALGAVAHNVANLNTDGFQASRAVAREVAGGGVEARLAPTGAPTPMLLRDGELVAGSNTDLVTETVNSAVATACYRVNLRMLSEASSQIGTLLDIMG
ncbi:MAG: hypothetical protein H6744_08045 [Deltaproteobacteria bacterium]|nr:hypothetical protein [Deltaproteobacteria bacterium]MCB9786631.1 hypothetical protein [Deltaproteobacteria bacterium]